MATGRLVVVCGLAAEAKIAVGRDRDDNVVVIAGGGDQARLAIEIEAVASGAAGILSFGVAGGLAPGLKAGDVRVADLVIAPGGELFTPHPGWAAAIRSGLARRGSKRNTLFSLMARRAKPASNHEAFPAFQPPGASDIDSQSLRDPQHFVLAPLSLVEQVRKSGRCSRAPVVRDAQRAPHQESAEARLDMALARFACVDTPLADCAGKAALHRATGADLVDMESHVAARVASRHGVPFAALRAVTDPAHRSLPHAATVGMRSDGTVDLAAILQSLKRDPAQVPGLVRTGFDARAAFASLLRGRQLLGARFALLDL